MKGENKSTGTPIQRTVRNIATNKFSNFIIPYQIAIVKIHRGIFISGTYFFLTTGRGHTRKRAYISGGIAPYKITGGIPRKNCCRSLSSKTARVNRRKQDKKQIKRPSFAG